MKILAKAAPHTPTLVTSPESDRESMKKSASADDALTLSSLNSSGYNPSSRNPNLMSPSNASEASESDSIASNSNSTGNAVNAGNNGNSSSNANNNNDNNGGNADPEKLKQIVKEYLSALDLAEAQTRIAESKAEGSELVKAAITEASESPKDKDAESVARFVLSLLQANILNAGDVMSGVSAFLPELADLLIDSPFAATSFGNVTGALVASDCLSLEFLRDCPQEVKRQHTVQLVKALLENALKQKDAKTVAAMVSKAKVDFSSFQTKQPDESLEKLLQSLK
jgi:hypothetical protein